MNKDRAIPLVASYSAARSGKLLQTDERPIMSRLDPLARCRLRLLVCQPPVLPERSICPSHFHPPEMSERWRPDDFLFSSDGEPPVNKSEGCLSHCDWKRGDADGNGCGSDSKGFRGFRLGVETHHLREITRIEPLFGSVADSG
jgi:hypothetical protein